MRDGGGLVGAPTCPVTSSIMPVRKISLLSRCVSERVTSRLSARSLLKPIMHPRAVQNTVLAKLCLFVPGRLCQKYTQGQHGALSALNGNGTHESSPDL